ncbi:uncharacterized protein B0P05DRAFT_603229 [Gilbertella persicaria]|uniref:uncharacterized protein n=1 Tax=Gilbertella persicaria TaxID=101096 RepID=UPI002220AD91|nr:uncharacterized protein B0P05DRAFT_603229 [Gilbertella persicaria]KAI8083213.1 hypothetical protein B0P05DRAFT_603229 [Gilbertella persicaria]
MSRITFYDLELLAKPGLVWSPNTCKTRFALNVKGIPYDTKWVDFGSMKTIIPSLTKQDKRPTVPIIIDSKNEQVIDDSLNIAHYLEKEFPENSLFHGNIAKPFFPIFKLAILKIHKSVGPQELQDWFKEDREAKYGVSLEQVAGDREANIASLKQGLTSIVQLLKEFPFITGDQVGWADVVFMSHLVFLEALEPELFESAVLNVFGSSDDTLKSYWTRTEKYRKIIPSSSL